jgi:diketogulonate reductase-like aldo/keto reductase
MQTRRFGFTNVQLPLIGQGTWDVPEHGSRLDEATRALRRGIELGMTHIDTAEMYGNGRAEEIVGAAIRGVPREKLFLTTKVLPGNASYAGTIAACERSLKRLGTDYLDLYLLHWPSSFAIAHTMGALEQLVADGKTRFIGVSNFDVEDLAEAQGALQKERLACNQVLYHVKERGIEARLIPFCNREEIAVVAYTPFGRGRFAADLRGGSELTALAQKYGKTPRQIVLRFLTRERGMFTIPKASTVAHVEENARATDFELSAGDIAAIDQAFPARTDGRLATL